MISHKHKFIFVHCHKCAGETIELAVFGKETKQIVTEKYAKDIEYFGYKFGE